MWNLQKEKRVFSLSNQEQCLLLFAGNNPAFIEGPGDRRMSSEGGDRGTHYGPNDGKTGITGQKCV